MRGFTVTYQQFGIQLTSERQIFRDFFIFWLFDHCTLNAYRNEAYFSYLCFVSRRCQDDRQSGVEILDDY